jgi:hypothetical protein
MHLPRLFLAAIFAFITGASLRAQSPEWIWSDGKPGDKDVRFFRKEFRMTDAPEKATLRFAADNKATAFLDGKPVGENTEWNDPTQVRRSRSRHPCGERWWLGWVARGVERPFSDHQKDEPRHRRLVAGGRARFARLESA